jgi:hypothetical protein
MVVVPVFESGRKLSTSAERFRGLATAYADAKLGKQKLRRGCVLVSRGGSFVYCFDVSMGYQAIQRLFFGCTRIFGPFFTLQPLTMSHKIASSSLFMVMASII